MKGCPLHCTWCYNPEGLSRDLQYVHGAIGTRKIGQIWSADKQAEFIIEVIDRIKGMHVVLDTSGYAVEEDFINVVNRCNLIVRVWGWSGYFCELELEYQDHIIERNMYSV